MLDVDSQRAEFFGRSKRFLPIEGERTIVAGRQIQALGELVLRYVGEPEFASLEGFFEMVLADG